MVAQSEQVKSSTIGKEVLGLSQAERKSMKTSENLKSSVGSKLFRSLIAAGIVYVSLITLCVILDVSEAWRTILSVIGALVVAMKILFPKTDAEIIDYKNVPLSTESTEEEGLEEASSTDIHRGNICSLSIGLSVFAGDDE